MHGIKLRRPRCLTVEVAGMVQDIVGAKKEGGEREEEVEALAAGERLVTMPRK